MTTVTATDRTVALALCRRDVGTYGDLVHGVAPAPHHRAWTDLLAPLPRGAGPRKLLIVAPPGHGKSTWLSLVFPAWYLGHRSDHNLLFFTSSDTMARQFGGTVKTTLEANPAHALVFPDPACRPDPDRGWSTDGLYLRGTPAGAKDPAYRALGYGASVIGARAHGVILDDPLTQEQARSPVEQEKARRYHDMTVDARLHPDGWALAIMTRWHESDLAAHLAAKDGWTVLEMPALGYWGAGAALWPERFDADWLRAKQRDIGGPLFACLYQGDPTSLGGEVFRAASWFRPLPDGFDRSSLTRVVQFWDLAFSERDTADYTVGVTLGRDGQGGLYVLGVYRERVGQAQLMNVIAQQVHLWRPAVVGIEEGAYKQAPTRDLVARLLRGGLPAHFAGVKPSADKVMRARLPAGRAEAGMLYADRGAPWFETFVAECFPAETPITAVDVRAVMVRRYTGDLVRIETPRGVLETTPEHPIWTDRGWVRAGTLQVGSRMLYTSGDGSSPQVQRGRIGDVVAAALADARCGRGARDGLDRWGGQSAETTPGSAPDPRPDGHPAPRRPEAQAVGLLGWFDRRGGHGVGEVGGSPTHGLDLRRQHLDRVDGLASGDDPGARHRSAGAPYPRGGAPAGVHLPDHRSGLAAALRGARAAPDRQASAHALADRVLPHPVVAAQQGAVDGAPAPNRRGDPCAQYEAVRALGRRAVVDLPVYNLETASHTYTALGYLVHNCLSFPNGVHDDQVDALAGATQLALEWRAPLQPVPVVFGVR